MVLQLRTARLVLRPVEPGDVDALLEMRNAPAVVATTGTGQVLPREQMVGQVSRRCASWRERGWGSWIVLRDGDPVAYVEVTPIGDGCPVDPGAIEIGVVVHPDRWGEGLAVEAGLAVARDLGERLGIDRAYAGVDPDNEKSLRALAKAPGTRRIDDELYELDLRLLVRQPPARLGHMQQRILGRTHRPVSVVGLGTWQLGADWGEVTERDARDVLEASAEAGVTFFDTADVYGDGRSEQLVGGFVAAHPDAGFVVATKMGRREEQVPATYVEANFRTWLDRSRRNLGVDTIDLVQLHCPPSAVIDADATYDVLDRLVEEQVVAAYGVSVETVDQALSALARPHVASVQIILNAFRMKPLEAVLPAAAAAGVGVIARVPLASGLLSGTYDLDTTFAADDHRTYNRDGSAFDVGETFSGVDYATGVEAAQEFGRLVADSGLGDVTPAQVAIAWAWQQPGVSTVIPGARNVAQARSNAAAGEAETLPAPLVEAIADLYDRRIREQVHARW